jgi:crossover junction endodeoxyribonuclease RuvC
VKKTIVGAGHCEKEQIRLMLRVLLPRPTRRHMMPPMRWPFAVTHAHHRQSALLKLKVAAAR